MSNERRVAIFANPIAGRGRGRILADLLNASLSAAGFFADVVFERADQVAEDRVRGLAAAVSIGGDGTLRSVVERLTDGGRHAGPGVLVVPMGTANLMGKHLGVGLSMRDIEHRAVAAIQNRKLVHLDAGVIRSANDHGTLARLFLLMAGIGIDGEIVHALDRVRKGPIGFTSYLKPAFATLAGYSYPRIQVEVDGRIIWPMASGVAFIGNIKEYGTGFEILPHARSDDRVLDVCVLPGRSASELIRHFLSAAVGEHLHGEGVVYRKGTNVQVRSDTRVAIQADGDPAGWTPASLELLGTRVAFIVP